VETRGDLRLQINPDADVRSAAREEHEVMNFTDYLIDSVLVLLVLLQIREKKLTTKTIVRPLILVGVAVANYLHGIPTAGNDLVLTACLACIGIALGAASGATIIMRRLDDGAVTARAGWASALLWVAGMGSRFAFVWWLTHTGSGAISTFSANHSITSGEAWTVALLAMAVGEVVSRTIVSAARRNRLQERHSIAPLAA
jgi:hypothetical protein